MSEEYIKKEEALDLLGQPITMSMCLSIDECASKRGQREIDYALIKAIPGADVVERKKGKWIDMGDFEQCSHCTGTHLKEIQTVYGKAIWIKSDFCPNCGADMRT